MTAWLGAVGAPFRRKPVVDLAAPARRTGPDAAAADTDREENHDPEAATAKVGLTEAARLENGTPAARTFLS